MNIVKNLDISEYAHRVDQNKCPYCKNSSSWEKWYENIKYIWTESKYWAFKENNWVIVSSCRFCYRWSWVHDDINAIKRMLDEKGIDITYGKI
jgi:hypothetical protein